MKFDIAEALGISIFLCLAWWPVTFLATKGSLSLTYRWQPFIIGFLISALILTAFTTIFNVVFGVDALVKNPIGAFLYAFAFPIVPCVFSVYVLRGRFITKELQRSMSIEKSQPLALTRISTLAWLSFKSSPDIWFVGATLLALFIAALFPNWVAEIRGYRFTLGRRFIFAPPTAIYPVEYVHVDLGLLFAHCVAITALGGIAAMFTYVFRRRR